MTDETAVELRWCKSSYSGNEGGECLEVALSPTTVHVRDSKDTAREGLALTPAAWTAFLGLTAP
ncbi:DUF397 domain-containing protein [Streptomyces fragilis]|uniref:DUF397 domain-containing protein n=1 Tax=Streptomyces fragilis TaxID=67301 RepID=A0ABV2YAE9_9ACTN|nr:DUF397 domain-containing protein [Streptomyces fragilis]